MTEPKVLLFDIETAPMEVYTFSLFKPIIGINQIKTPPRVLCWSARWVGTKGKTVMFDSEFASGTHDMLVGLRDLLDEADVVVGYNSDNFDITWMNQQFLYNQIELPSPFTRVDLYKLNKKHLRMPSGKLDYLSFTMLGDNKVQHRGFGLWVDCMAGDAKAWKEMERYAKKDTLLLEPLYNIFKPFITAVNVPLYTGSDFGCTHCGSTNLQKRGFSFTSAGKYQRYQCVDCSSWSKDPKRLDTTTLRPMANV